MNTAGIEQVLRDRIGLDIQSIGRTSLQCAIDQRMAALGICTPEEYRTAVATSSDEFQELIEAIVVPETWFFRHPEAFAELAAIGDRWIRESARTLRLLSVPCSTGEEPYSMAIALLERGIPPERFVVDAVDISKRNVLAGERGLFGRNSFRSDSAPALNHVVSVRKRYRIADAVQRQVRFRHGNLLAEDFLAQHGPYDAVFCRNLLIYFDADAQRRALRTVDRLLAPEGVLFVGPADGFAALTFGFAPAGRSGAFSYCRPAANARRAQPSSTVSALRPRRNVRVPSHAPARKPQVTKPGAADVTGSVPEERVTLARARDLADAGRLREAAEACAMYLKSNGPCADAYYLLGLLADAEKDAASATNWYRKALYLNPHHADALAQLALLSAQQGRGEQATVLNARARRAASADAAATRELG
jgi:chemotaxis protein methyltransferase WspC